MTTTTGPISVAGRVVDQPVTVLRAYAQRYPATIRTFDAGGHGHPAKLTRDEVVRTRVIASRISEAEAEWFVDVARDAPWDGVPADADLREADPQNPSGLYAASVELYDYFKAKSPPGVAIAKVSKVLHLKRPSLIPILDSHLLHTYRVAATKAGLQYSSVWGEGRRLYWAAIRLDLIEPTNAASLVAVRRELQAEETDPVKRMASLTDLRLLDILTWTP